MPRSTSVAGSPARWMEDNWPRFVVGPGIETHQRFGHSAPRAAGIYFLRGCDEKLLYVGSSDDITYRVAQHIWSGKVPFERFSMLEIDTDEHPWALVVRRFEQCYIRALTPPYNSRTEWPFRQAREMESAIRNAWGIAE